MTYVEPTVLEPYNQLIRFSMNENTNYDFPKHGPFVISGTVDNLSVSSCKVTQIGLETFSKLPNLYNLELNNNQISYIDPNSFKHNPKLYYLQLEDNKLKTFNELGRINHVRNLGSLFLSGNTEFSLNTTPFMDRSDVFRVFECENCSINEACNSIVKNFPRLMRLKLMNNQVKSFECLVESNLYFVDFSGNPVEQVTIRSKKLKNFICDDCQLRALTSHMFSGSTNVLQKIHLNRNQIEKIEENVFEEMKELKELMLDHNSIENFPPKIIDQAFSLETLCIDGNPLKPSLDATSLKRKYAAKGFRQNCPSEKHFEDLLPNIKNEKTKILVPVKAKGKYFSRATQEFIDKSNQDIEYIYPDYFQEGVKQVNLSYNPNLNFEAGKPFLDHLTIESLYLTDCAITIVYKETFSKLPNLKILDLTNNRISFIYENAFELTTLETLTLDYNEIQSLTPKSIDTAKYLTVLSMNGNSNFDFDEDRIFLYHSGLQRFYCDDCGITAIYSSTFSKLTNLRELTVSGNRIAEIEPDAFENNKQLRYLNLDKNKLTSFPLSLVKNLKHLKYLCLDENDQFNFDYSEDNVELKKYYETKELRSTKCSAVENESLYFERKLPKPTTTSPPERVSLSPSRQLFNALNGEGSGHAVDEKPFEPKTKTGQLIEDEETLYDDDISNDDDFFNETAIITSEEDLKKDDPVVKVASIPTIGGGTDKIFKSFSIFLILFSQFFYLLIT